MAHLSKSRFVAGHQCPKLLWWKVHEPRARELEPDVVVQDLFDQGALVGERAREEVQGGVLIEGERTEAGRAERTRRAIDAGASVLFEATFEADGCLCTVDVLQKHADGWTLIEVKSSSEVKDYHLPDVAVQVHVLRRSGINVTRAQVMHMNREYRHLRDGALFTRSDVTALIEPLLRDVPEQIATLIAMLEGPLPVHPIGLHCATHGDCAFFARCWPDDDDHIRHMWNVGTTTALKWMAKGVHTMSTIPAKEKLNDKQKRQLRAQQDKTIIVERGLSDAMAPALNAKRLGFLDFEAISRALPVWNGLKPWAQIAAQFSYHERGEDGAMTHAEFLAEGPEDPSQLPDDPREPLALAMIAATAHADVIVVYTSYEATRIKGLAADLPHLAAPLNALLAKLWDLFPVVSNHVYHPDFRGSFSLKYILNPLVPDLSYSDLIIVDGMTASVEIARLLFVSGRIPLEQRDQTRRDLLEYCKRDTYATVRLVDRLAELARP